MASFSALLHSRSCGQTCVLRRSQQSLAALRLKHQSQPARPFSRSTSVMAMQPATAEKESTMTASRRAALLLLMSLPVAAQAQAQQATAPPKGYELKQMAGSSRYEVKPEDRLDFATSSLPAFTRLGTAAFVGDGVENFKRPEKMLELYEFQGCPFCRKVREAITLLDLDVMIYPCPKGGTTYRNKAMQMSGKSQFPFLVDSNTGQQMLESDDIIKYLYDTYGDGKVPLSLSLGPLTTLSAGLGQAGRLGKGISYRPSKKPEKPIELWAYEASPFCLQTREVLTELEIPHIYRSVARKSPKRPAFEAKWGVFQVPYIEDPNTMQAWFETPEINKYLNNTYGA